MSAQASTALIVIGRNEARHLRTSLPAVTGLFDTIVYVDSGSTDDSREVARAAGAKVIELDMSQPFTAARARNAGFEAVDSDNLRYAQFIDGDCELIPGYVEAAIRFLEDHPDFGMVCGRRLERYPERSIFNRLCHLEWNTPVGETQYCGGDVTVRAEALRQIGGYDPTLIAGEDPEVCVRLRQAGWRIQRIDADMTWHDANITRISQWWKRQQRTGHAFAEGAFLHGRSEQRHWVKEARSNWFWGGLFFATLIAGLLISPWLWLMLLIFPLQALRLALKAPPPIDREPFRIRLAYGLDCFLAKAPEFIGQLKFTLNRLLGRRQKLIEYK